MVILSDGNQSTVGAFAWESPPQFVQRLDSMDAQAPFATQRAGLSPNPAQPRGFLAYSNLVAQPVAEILFNNKTVDAYNLYEIDENRNSERFICKLILRPGSTRQAVKENAVKQVEARFDYDEE